MLVVSYALGVEGFVMKEEDSRWFSYEPSREQQRKKEKGLTKVTEIDSIVDKEWRTNEREFVVMNVMEDEALSYEK